MLVRRWGNLVFLIYDDISVQYLELLIVGRASGITEAVEWGQSGGWWLAQNTYERAPWFPVVQVATRDVSSKLDEPLEADERRTASRPAVGGGTREGMWTD